jgi:hypothetical protein
VPPETEGQNGGVRLQHAFDVPLAIEFIQAARDRRRIMHQPGDAGLGVVPDLLIDGP